MNIIGLDASLTHIGVSIISDFVSDITMQKPGQKTMLFKTKKKGLDRLVEIEIMMQQVLVNSYCNHQLVDYVIIEGYAFSPIQGRAFSMGEGGWAVRRPFHLKGIPILQVAPATLKKFITGSGRGDKNTIMLHVFKKWGVEFAEDDECDAYGLAKIGEALYQIKNGRNVKELLVYEQECIKGVLEYNDMSLNQFLGKKGGTNGK